MSDTKNNRHLHLVRVREDERVLRVVPARVEAKGIRVAIGVALDALALANLRELPTRVEEVECLGEEVVIDEAGVHGESAHEQDDVTAVEEGPDNLHASASVNDIALF
jgi:hypothetical protein